MGEDIFSLTKAGNPELCRSIVRNFLTQDRLKRTSPYHGLSTACGTIVIRQKLDYIHRNPVVAGIVGLPEHYLLSSASNYQKAHLPERQTNCKLEIDLLEGIWNDEGFVFMGR